MLLLANPDLIIPSQFPFQMNFFLFFYSHEIKCNVDQIDRSALNINHVMSKEPIQETIQTTTLQNVFPVTKFTSTKVITRKKKNPSLLWTRTWVTEWERERNKTSNCKQHTVHLGSFPLSFTQNNISDMNTWFQLYNRNHPMC